MNRKRGFTLIELLVVITIIGIIIGLLLPAISSSMAKAERVQAKGDAQRIVKAWKDYWNQYGRWPSSANENGTGVQMDSVLVGILITRTNQIGTTISPDNPLAIKFMDISGESLTSSRSFVDPWGTPYRVSFDVNSDGKASNTWATVYDKVIAWSAGPDAQDSTVKDNIKSWE